MSSKSPKSLTLIGMHVYAVFDALCSLKYAVDGPDLLSICRSDGVLPQDVSPIR